MAAARLAWLALGAVALTEAVKSTPKKPHVLLIFADDYGWGNFAVHRRGLAETAAARQAKAEVHTPNLDALADAGILLERHYAYKICAPSRAALQSGRLAVHVNAKNTGVTSHNPDDPVSGWSGIPRNMTGLAAKMRLGGYRTHMVGKWDAGMATPEHTPLGRGYETWLGYFQHANDYWRKSSVLTAVGEIDNCLNSFIDLSMHNATYRGGVRDAASLTDRCKDDEEADPGCYEEHLFKERGLSVIRGHDVSKADEPLFLFYAFHLLHTPLQVPKSYLERIDRLVAASGGLPFSSANRRLYAAMTLYMDDAVGELVAALKAKGMWEDTLVIFSSDNGGPIYAPGSANNHPLKGGKYSDWEGGVRTNAFLSGGFVPPEKRGTRFDGVMSIADWYGTLCELAGVDQTDHAAEEANVALREKGLPLLPPVDSVAQWQHILDGSNGRPESLHISEQAVLQWPFKLVTGLQVYSAWQGDLYPNCSSLEALRRGQGASFTDLKVFGAVVSTGGSEEANRRVTWTEDCGAGCLYNVEADPTEHENLASDPEHSAILEGLQRTLEELNGAIFQPDRGTGALEACEVAIENGGFYGPFSNVDGWYSEQPVPSLPERLRRETLRTMLRVADNKVVQEAVVGVARLVVPTVARHTFDVSDKCLGNESFAIELQAPPRPQAPRPPLPEMRVVV